MKEPNLYLKPNVVPEPLFQQWYAWPHLVSPATAAMNVLNRHLRIIESYIRSPRIHARFVKDPKMRGGPFVDYRENRLTEVERLKQRTLDEQAQLIQLAKEITGLNKLLKEEAVGYSMLELYEKVPELLKGYVELVYDLNNQPAFRFFEALLYKSEYYKDEYQSIAFYIIENDDRPFILSTPRIEEDSMLHIKIPFADKAIDALFKMQREPAPYSVIKNKLRITDSQDEKFRSFFTAKPPSSHKGYQGEGIQTRYFGHACILVETKDFSILTDPVISYGYDSEISRYTYTDLPDHIDYVLITHNHQDHILLETMLQLRHKIGQIIVPRNDGGSLQDPNLKLMFNAIGFDNVIQMEELERLEVDGCSIIGLPFIGEHSDLNIRSKLCYYVRLDQGPRILFAADSCNFESKLYEYVYREIGDVDVLFLGMECDGAPLSWLYGPLLPETLPRDMDQSRRLAGSNFKQGMDLVNRFNPAEVFVYAMGQEPWLNYVMSLKYTEDSNPIVASNKLIDACHRKGIVAERLFGEKILNYS